MPGPRRQSHALFPRTLLLAVILLSGCDTSRMFFHQDVAGNRYYQTDKGDVLRVTTDGEVYKGQTRVGKAASIMVYNDAGRVKDWDVKPYGGVPPSYHCSTFNDDEIQPAPCWEEFAQVMTMVATAPAMAVYRMLPNRDDASAAKSRSPSGIAIGSSELPQ